MGFLSNLTKGTLLLVLVAVLQFNSYAQIGIGTKTPHPSAAFHIKDDARGLLIPRLTQQQINENIKDPANGLMVYQTDKRPGFYFYNGKRWESLLAASVSERGIIDMKAPIKIGRSSQPAQCDKRTAGTMVWDGRCLMFCNGAQWDKLSCNGEEGSPIGR